MRARGRHLFKGPLCALAVEARWALAFVARRAGRASMEASAWRHVLSLELGWMTPKEAARYVQACQAAGLLVPEGDHLQLAFDAKQEVIPRGFRPDPATLPERTGDVPAAPAPEAAPAPASADDQGDFASWLPRVAQARGEEVPATLAAVEALQEEAGGLLHAEAALLWLAAQAGLDVRTAARGALSRLRA